MKKAAFILAIIFSILTFIGAAYVIINHGQVNAGYSVIPCILGLICLVFYRNKK